MVLNAKINDRTLKSFNDIEKDKNKQLEKTMNSNENREYIIY